MPNIRRERRLLGYKGASNLRAARLRLGKPTFALRDYGLASQLSRCATTAWQANFRAARLRLGKSGARDARRRRAIPFKSPLQFASLLRFATVAHPGYTVDSFAPAQLALRANLRLVYLAPAPALDCLSLGKCAIARVFAPTHVALRAAFARQCWFAFFPVCLTLRAALCSLPRNRPFACFPASARWHLFSAALRLPRSLPLISPFGLPAAGYPASARWHVFRFPVSTPNPT